MYRYYCIVTIVSLPLYRCYFIIAIVSLLFYHCYCIVTILSLLLYRYYFIIAIVSLLFYHRIAPTRTVSGSDFASFSQRIFTMRRRAAEPFDFRFCFHVVRLILKQYIYYINWTFQRCNVEQRSTISSGICARINAYTTSK